MSIMKIAYTNQEIRNFFGYKAVSSVIRRAEKEGWQARPRQGRGGGNEWLVSSMPKATRQAIAELLLSQETAVINANINIPALQRKADTAITASVPAISNSLPATSSTFGAHTTNSFAPLSTLGGVGQLSVRQRTVMEARLAFVREIERLTPLLGKEAAIHNLLKQTTEGTLPEQLRQLIPLANNKYNNSGRRGLSRPRLYAWCSAYNDGGEVALAPRNPSMDMRVPEWAPVFLSRYRRPQKPSVSEAYREFLNLWDGLPPSEFTVRRFLKKLSPQAREEGRKGALELLSLKAMVRRDTSKFWPGDIYTADGHTFDAEIANPFSGKPFRPEITSVLDVATRRLVGVSIAQAESGLAVLDAIRMSAMDYGIPAILYVDNGSGYRNAMMSRLGTGLLSRLGTTISHSIPKRSQSRGLIERSQKTMWVTLAKKLPTCVHADMDREARQKIFKLTRNDIKLSGRSQKLMPWDQFKTLVQGWMEEYNNRPHKGLPFTVDQLNGKRRHMTPVEAWNEAVEEGWEPMQVPQDMADDLFRPVVVRAVRRGEVTLFNNIYFHEDLVQFHGEPVHVGYDVWDPQRVWVRSSEGALICVAEWNANRRDYFPASFVEQAHAARRKGQVLRLESKIKAIAAEDDAVIDLPKPSEAELAQVRKIMAQERQQTQQEPVLERRPAFLSKSHHYEWLMRHRDQCTETDATWLRDYIQTEEYAHCHDRYKFEGLAWSEDTMPSHENADINERENYSVNTECSSLGGTQERDLQKFQEDMIERRPLFQSSSQKYAWLMQNRNRQNGVDQEWLREYVKSAEYADLRDLYEFRGLGWTEDDMARDVGN